MSALRTSRILLVALITGGVVAGLAGLLETSQLSAGDPTIGPGFLLPVIAAVFLGSTQFRGGRFNIWGTVVAAYALFLRVTETPGLAKPAWSDVTLGREVVLRTAVDRDTALEPYLDVLPEFDTLLVMTIKAGFGGQAFLPALLDKVRLARRHIASGHLRLFLEVDGGIDADTITQAAEAGADVFVAGTAVFGADDPGKAVDALRVKAREAVSRRTGT